MKKFNIKDLNPFKVYQTHVDAEGASVKIHYFVECLTELDIVYIEFYADGNGDDDYFDVAYCDYEKAFDADFKNVELVGNDEDFNNFYEKMCNTPLSFGSDYKKVMKEYYAR